MYMTMNMPLSGLIDKSLKGEARITHKEWLHTYVKNLTKGNKTKLKQVLSEIDEAINQWRDNYFISTYEEKLSAVRQGKLNMDSRELEDTYHEENCLQKEGKTGLVADFLYEAIAKYGFINEHHRDAIESAWLFYDMEFLRSQWEYYALGQIRSLREVVCSMLGTVPVAIENEQQTANRPLKRFEDYPEVFDIKLCCELTNYAKDTIYKWTRTREIPCHRSGTNGRKLVFKRDEIVEWLTARKQETKEEFIQRMESQLAAKVSTLYNNPKKFKKHD